MEKFVRASSMLGQNTHEFSTAFVINSKTYLQNLRNYSDRHTILEGILRSWEILKKELSTEDLIWLKDKIQNLRHVYQKTNFRYQYANDTMSKYLRPLFCNGMGGYLALSMMIMLTLSSFPAVISIIKYQKAALEVLKEYLNIELSGKVDPKDLENLDKLRRWVNYLIKDLQLENNIPQAILQLEKVIAEKVTMLYAILIVAISLAPVCYATFFFCAPAAKKPPTLPQWVNDELSQRELLRPN